MQDNVRGELPQGFEPRHSIYKAVTALVRGNALPGGEEAYLKTKGDPITRMVLKAATSPATLSNTGWAGALASEALVDFLLNLGPASAASQLISQSLGLQFEPGQSAIKTPAIIPQSLAGAFVEESEPGRVQKFAVAGPSFGPKKMMILAALTREMAKSSNAEAIIKDVLQQCAALTFDTFLFSGEAASAAAPAGLLYGALEVTADSGGGEEAMINDLSALAGKVAPIAGGSIMFAANPVEAVKIAIRAGANFPYPVLPTAGIPEGTVAAVAPRAVAFAVEPTPDIAVSSETTLHMEDENPEQISQAGSPATVSAPVQSMFQTAQIAIRLTADVSWVKRHASAAAYVDDVSW